MLKLLAGSHLYGTATPTSDEDFKVIVVPDLRDLLLGKRLGVDRVRYDASGNTVGEHETMPPNGWEAEIVPVHKLVHDYLGGQAYAVEAVFACQDAGRNAVVRDEALLRLCARLRQEFTTSNVDGMVGFAVKQVFDYVRRGERLNEAEKVRDVLLGLVDTLHLQTLEGLRFDDAFDGAIGFCVLDYVIAETGLQRGQTTNNGRTMDTLELNGRSYLETSQVTHVLAQVDKLIKSYGDRTRGAAEKDVDWKSLSHAVRVFQQTLELLYTGTMVFPRWNAEDLLQIKKGLVPLEDVKEQLKALEDELVIARSTTKLPPVTPELKVKADELLLSFLREQFNI